MKNVVELGRGIVRCDGKIMLKDIIYQYYYWERLHGRLPVLWERSHYDNILNPGCYWMILE